MEGALNKWTNVMKGWQLRWFVLDDHTGLLSYYTSKEKMMRGTRRGCVRLAEAIVSIEDEDQTLFSLTVDDKTFHLQARDGDERDAWVHCLEDTVARMNHSAPFRFRRERGQPVPTMADFDRQLVESDAYLQLLIQQADAISKRQQQLTHSDVERQRLADIGRHVHPMLDSIKHSIVRLQIAKNEVHPAVSSLITFNSSSSRMTSSILAGDVSGAPESDGSTVAPTDQQPSTEHLSDPARSKSALIEPDDCIVDGTELDSMVVAGAGNSLGRRYLRQEVPETSYSSSEDEDWFDTEETTVNTCTSPAALSLYRSPPAVSACSTTPSPAPPPPPTTSDSDSQEAARNWHEYDRAYEEEEGDLGSMEACSSVISHLLSQMRIGMDLTRVVLPTFILERRSLLEMYADFFAHPDLFASIPHCTTPRLRMVQVLKWYLSAFHAGRKSEVAKKPYNPIIGETFRCVFDLPDDLRRGASRNLAPDNTADASVPEGPVPWGRNDQVCFVAEQVSHHPPVSAFYAEHMCGRLSFCGHIWTKSKFLGLSIGVHNIGQGCVSVIDHNEEYILTFPSGYGRSILGVPWIELGGTVTITCNSTGYTSTVEFLTKPFYGGRKHRVTAEVLAPGQKKPFLQVEGEWNGVMTAKWESGETEVFVDTKSAPLVKKQVRSIREQDEFESRRLWKDVTYNLKYNNIEAATEAKCFLEQRQRDEAKQRTADGTQWQTKLFHKMDENWIYDAPLQGRLQDHPQTGTD